MIKKFLYLFGVVFLFGYLSFFVLTPYLKDQLVSGYSKEDVTTEFISYMTEVHGVTKLQVAELSQMEVITKESRKKILWDKLELPPVVVSLEVPVEYVYYVDLEKKWKIERHASEVRILAPSLEFNAPAANVSKMNFVVKKSSLFRNEDELKRRLLKSLTPYLEERAFEQRELVRESARKQLFQLAQKWLEGQEYGELRVIVIFDDEKPQEIKN